MWLDLLLLLTTKHAEIIPVFLYCHFFHYNLNIQIYEASKIKTETFWTPCIMESHKTKTGRQTCAVLQII